MNPADTAAQTRTAATGRDFRIDALRAFAMIAIVLSHSIGPASEGAYDAHKLFFASAALFFMCSGALIFPVRPSAGQFLRRRLASYVPQWLVFTIIYVILIYQSGKFDPYYWRKDLEFGWLLSPWGGGWFLYALTGLYLFAPVLSPWITKASRRNVGIFVTLWLISGLFPFLQSTSFASPEESLVAPFAGFAGYMVAGYWLYRWPVTQDSPWHRVRYFGILLLVAVGLGVPFYLNGLKWHYETVFYYDLSFNVMAANMIIFAAFTFLPARCTGVFARTLRWISRHSLTIYLWHLIIIKYVLQPLGIPDLLVFVITMAVCLPLSAVTDLAFAPLRRRLSR